MVLKRLNIITLSLACVICTCSCENMTESQIYSETDTVEKPETYEMNINLSENIENDSFSDNENYCDNIDAKEDNANWDAWMLMEEINVGWNLGNSLGTAAAECGYDANLEMETIWGNPKVSKELIDYVKSLGFNTIRIPVSWCYNCGRDENGKIKIGEQWLKRVHEVVDYAIDNDMYVILNTMCDAWVLFRCGVEDETEWKQVQQDTEDLWRQIAQSFAEYDKRLIFEGFNEIDNVVTGFTYSDLSAEQMNILNQIFVTTVRSTEGSNIKRILLVPTLFDSTLTQVTDAFRLPEDDVNNEENYLIVSVHCYESEFDQDIEWKFQTLQEFSNRIGAPILITEFGAKDDYVLSELREEFTSNYIARANKYGIKCCIWDDGYHWKLVDRYDYSQTNMDMIEAIFAGVAGQNYETDFKNKMVLDNIDDFYFGDMNLSTGCIEMVDYQNKYWATLTTKTKDNRFLETRDGDYLCISMKTKGAATNFWINYICFLDEKQNVIEYKKDKNILHRFLCTKIPDDAKYFVVNTYDPYSNYAIEDIQQYLEKGDLSMSITFVNIEESDSE
ncbi:glycoside hydrolase family 5 protein [Waltera intestinalis]|uniref:Glycoside hydrolase family 5 protein n=1 Tax=Waltera intestinalis TaxID=2606635 RepID=A0A6L5YIU7_9FIRM|nr:glycoside hydrolase family 5 protein [Waltera intestinalis]MST58334.1 glycoside hydrolase family 5 protein [Waltera intestinalis]